MRVLILLAALGLTACASSRAKHTPETIREIEDNVSWLIYVRHNQRLGVLIPLETQIEVNKLREQGYGYEIHDKLAEMLK